MVTIRCYPPEIQEMALMYMYMATIGYKETG